jgi:MFS family permease
MPARHVEDHKWWTLTAVCVATFMLLIDITIVNVALPDIAKALHSSFTDLQWVIDAYALSLAALLLTWGATSDRVGRRYIFVVGLGIFTVASLGCALSTSPLMLNLARAVQGVGGAAMFATSLALLASAFHGRERGTAVGIWGATIGAAVAIGPLAGGALTETIGWESIFYINVPSGSRRSTSRSRGGRVQGPQRRPERLARARHLLGGLFLLIFALVRGNARAGAAR